MKKSSVLEKWALVLEKWALQFTRMLVEFSLVSSLLAVVCRRLSFPQICIIVSTGEK